MHTVYTYDVGEVAVGIVEGKRGKRCCGDGEWRYNMVHIHEVAYEYMR
jgi:hypothetical protein